MPPLGFLIGKVDFSHLYIDLSASSYASLADAQKAGAPIIKYGLFINELTNFLIVAFVISCSSGSPTVYSGRPSFRRLRPRQKNAPTACLSSRSRLHAAAIAHPN
jgi:hypothetical protein